MFKFLKKLFAKPQPEGRCSRFGGVQPTFSAADYDAMKRLERARDAAWERARQRAADANREGGLGAARAREDAWRTAMLASYAQRNGNREAQA